MVVRGMVFSFQCVFSAKNLSVVSAVFYENLSVFGKRLQDYPKPLVTDN